MNARDKVIDLIKNRILDSELVARECLARMSTDECQDMIDECDWDSPPDFDKKQNMNSFDVFDIGPQYNECFDNEDVYSYPYPHPYSSVFDDNDVLDW